MCRVVAEVSVQRGQASFARRLFIRAGEQLRFCDEPGEEAWPLKALERPCLVCCAHWTWFWRGRRVYLPTRRETPAVTESAMRHAVLHHPRYREKSGPISHRHGDLRVGTLRRIYGHSFAAGQSLDTTLYELLELPGSHNVSDLHVAMLQQDYDDGLLERKVKKVLCRK
jgi:hypothetical protein